MQFVGVCRTNADTCISQEVKVSEISCINIAQANVPRFRAMNEEIAKFDEVMNKSLGGVLVDGAGLVRALWNCYSFYSWQSETNHESFHAMGVELVTDIIKPLLTAAPVYPLQVPVGVTLVSHSTGDLDLGGAGSNDGGEGEGEGDEAFADAHDGEGGEIDAPEGWPAYWPRCRSLDLGLKRLPLSTAR